MLKTTHNIVGEKKKEHSIFLGKAKANTLQKGMQLESPCHLTHHSPQQEKRSRPQRSSCCWRTSLSCLRTDPQLLGCVVSSSCSSAACGRGFQSPAPGAGMLSWTFPSVLTARCQWASYACLETTGLQHMSISKNQEALPQGLHREQFRMT